MRALTISLLGFLLACDSADGTQKSPAAPKDAEAKAADAPSAEAPAPATYSVKLYNFTGQDCEYVLAAADEKAPSGDTAKPLRFDLNELTMSADQVVRVRAVGGEEFPVSASAGKSGATIVLTEGCREVATHDRELSNEELVALRPHELEACCAKCDGECSMCTVADDPAACKPEQTVAGRCTVFHDIVHCVAAPAGTPLPGAG